MREHLAARERFLSNKNRLASLKRLIQPSDTEQELDLAMIAVVLGANASDIMELLCTMAGAMVSDDLGLEQNPRLSMSCTNSA